MIINCKIVEVQKYLRFIQPDGEVDLIKDLMCLYKKRLLAALMCDFLQLFLKACLHLLAD